jgi:transaldolase / glucose-6-phosphate isomerase
LALPAQIIFNDLQQETFQRELKLFRERHFVQRLWSKDQTLWPAEEENRAKIRSNLNWLDFPELLSPYLKEVRRTADSALADNFENWALISLGSANLAARALLAMESQAHVRKLVVLDSAEPSAIARFQEQIDLQRTLFVIAAKSGNKLEDQALLLYFQARLRAAGVQNVESHFATGTSFNSYLGGISKVYAFRNTLYDPPGIISSFSSLLHFGAISTVLFELEPEEVLAGCKSMKLACSSNSETDNPALQLAAFLSSSVLTRRSRLSFLTPPKLIPYAFRLRELIGGSLANERFGNIPVVYELPGQQPPVDDSSAFVAISVSGEENVELQEALTRIQTQGVPFVHIKISQALDLLAETFKWEIATALTGARLGLNPFDWPDVQTARRLAMEMLNKLAPGLDTLARQPRNETYQIQLFAEGRSRREISSLNVSESLYSFLQLRQPEGILALLVFMDRTPLVEEAIGRIRKELIRHLRQPVLLLYGPRSEDHYGYLLREGLPTQQFLVFTAKPEVDLPIPGASYTFGQLNRALALGEFEGIAQAGRLVIRLHLKANLAEGFTELEQLFERTLRRIHPPG